jgi:hypothetical protein
MQSSCALPLATVRRLLFPETLLLGAICFSWKEDR